MHLFNWPFGDINPHSYDMIMADPPWRFLVRSPKGEGKSAQAHYDTMALEEINALPVMDLAAPNCVLWLWCTAPMLPQQLTIVKAWGFEYRTEGRLGEDDQEPTFSTVSAQHRTFDPREKGPLMPR
jgi:N6-adenosine-specific RNA methylase IME4